MTREPVTLPANIKHGSQAAYLRHRCRCLECSRAHTSYMKAYKHDKHRGIDRTVPAADVRAHIERCVSAGMTTGQIAAVAGLKSHRVVWSIMQPHRTYVQRHIAEAILAVVPGSLPHGMDDQAETFVPAEPSRRRIRALLALGWPHRELTARSGVTTHVMLHQASPRVTWRSHRRIVELYDALSMTPGPSERTRRRAAAYGYAPPLAWDDDILDADFPLHAEFCDTPGADDDEVDEVAVIRFIGGDITWDRLTTKERLEAAVRLDRAGVSRNEISERTHLNTRTLWDHLRASQMGVSSSPHGTIAS